jgi:hypothetical protein
MTTAIHNKTVCIEKKERTGHHPTTERIQLMLWEICKLLITHWIPVVIEKHLVINFTVMQSIDLKHGLILKRTGKYSGLASVYVET